MKTASLFLAVALCLASCETTTVTNPDGSTTTTKKVDNVALKTTADTAALLAIRNSGK